MRSWPAVLLAIVSLPAASAFDSVPPGSSVHDEVTAVAGDAGWPAHAVEALQQAVREPDFQDSEVDPEGTDVGRIDATADYRPEHHCDRGPSATDEGAFDATVAYVAAQRADALAKARSGDPDGAVAALGRALHALQDCYSHSDVVDSPSLQRAFEGALLHNGTAAQVGGPVRIVGYAPGEDDPEEPAGDPYPHKRFAKDSTDKNDEARAVMEGNVTKFEAAVSLARLATVAFVQEFTHELSSSERAAVLHVSEEDHGLPDDANVPAPGWPALAVVAMAVAAMRRR